MIFELSKPIKLLQHIIFTMNNENICYCLVADCRRFTLITPLLKACLFFRKFDFSGFCVWVIKTI